MMPSTHSRPDDALLQKSLQSTISRYVERAELVLRCKALLINLNCLKTLFIESWCDDEHIIEDNVRRVKISSPDVSNILAKN